MELYVKVDWPESQQWIDAAHYYSSYGIYEHDTSVFVPLQLYCEHCILCMAQPKGEGLYASTSLYKGKDCKMFKCKEQ